MANYACFKIEGSLLFDTFSKIIRYISTKEHPNSNFNTPFCILTHNITSRAHAQHNINTRLMTSHLSSNKRINRTVT